MGVTYYFYPFFVKITHFITFASGSSICNNKAKININIDTAHFCGRLYPHSTTISPARS